MTTRSGNDQRQAIVAALDEAMKADAAEMKRRTDRIQRDLAALRDALIENLRRAYAGGAPGDHAALKAVNVALSLLMSVEFPVTSIQASSLEKARKELAQVPAEMWMFEGGSQPRP
ncbi:MAG TPA: hypothetical protein VGH50_20100 [Candidatus Binatia bacterium]|jgi:hypothetical protein